VDEESVVAWIQGSFEPLEHVVTDGNRFFFFDPDHLFPFATIVTNDRYDGASDLERPGVYRLNIGVGKQTWIRRFGEPTKRAQGEHGLDSGTDVHWDFSALDTVMPHPVYGRQHWLCVLNPSDATFESIKPDLEEAYRIDRERSLRKRVGTPAAEWAGSSSSGATGWEG
jgi:hypothetical protein